MCKTAKCGDGFLQAGAEFCDDGNNVDNDGCPANCGCGNATLLTTWNSWKYYKVPVNGVMSDANVRNTCLACGLNPPCQALAGCTYNDNLCKQTNNETSCGNPGLGLAKQLCGVNAAPSNCPALYNVYHYMGFNWVNQAACGAIANNWCTVGTNYNNQFAVCVGQ